MTDSNPYPSAPHRSADWDPAGTSEQEKQQATEKFKKNGSGTDPSTSVPSDPVPDRPGDPKPAEIAGSQKDVSSRGVEREQEPDSPSKF